MDAYLPIGPRGRKKGTNGHFPDLALGWTMRAGTDKIGGGKAKVILDAPEKDSLRMKLLADKGGTYVLIERAEPKPAGRRESVR